jgi:hypothetical protein
MKEYYDQIDLMEIPITEYLEEIEQNVYTFDLYDISDYDYYDADYFRHGACQLFAYALNEIFGYEVYIISADKDIHIFCRSGSGDYIDVRGKTKSFKEFISGTDLPDIKVDTSKKYTFIEEDFLFECSDILLEFARAIIRNDMDRYSI